MGVGAGVVGGVGLRGQGEPRGIPADLKPLSLMGPSTQPGAAQVTTPDTPFFFKVVLNSGTPWQCLEMFLFSEWGQGAPGHLRVEARKAAGCPVTYRQPHKSRLTTPNSAAEKPCLLPHSSSAIG